MKVAGWINNGIGMRSAKQQGGCLCVQDDNAVSITDGNIGGFGRFRRGTRGGRWPFGSFTAKVCISRGNRRRR
jgi:hypothetical protein